jgi:hypothetical protein
MDNEHPAGDSGELPQVNPSVSAVAPELEIVRPIPRRPFKLHFTSPTPPSEDDDDDDDNDMQRQTPNISASDLRFLDPSYRTTNHHRHHQGTDTPLSRATSFLNLTSSTLFGIYAPSFSSPSFSSNPTPSASSPRADHNNPGYYNILSDRVGGGEETSVRRRPGLDEKTYSVIRRRSSAAGSSSADAARFMPGGGGGGGGRTQQLTTTRTRGSMAMALVLRAGLLFLLGVGYGVLVTRTRFPAAGHEQGRQGQGLLLMMLKQQGGQGGDDRVAHDGYEWRYVPLALWGAAGVVLGGLLPWFDKFWERRAAAASPSSGRVNKAGRSGGDGVVYEDGESDDGGDGDGEIDVDPMAMPTRPAPVAATSAETDWALVVRGIGAFVGIVFAIRKLPWASTMQVSLTLALTNPFLWYLIDRSKPGFLLSAAVGLAGSAAFLLLGLVNPDMLLMMVPSAAAAAGVLDMPGSSSSPGGSSSSWSLFASNRTGGGGTSGGYEAAAAAALGNGTTTTTLMAAMGRLASQETVETTIWMLSVLFCSCVCFGNIGRRLALNSSAAGRGRWGGVR